MSGETNPYQPPPLLDSQRQHEHAAWMFVFWVGVAFLFVGLLAVFVPNLPPFGWLIMSAGLLVPVAIGSPRYRRRSLIVLALTLLLGTIAFYRIQRIRKYDALERSVIEEYERMLEADNEMYEVEMAPESRP